MDNNELEKNHLITLNFLDVFLKICNENNIGYFMAEGSCLGAIRHNGFIPWDVNIDINMTLPEYMKFDAIMSKKNIKDYVWENPNNSGRLVKWISVQNKEGYKVIPNLDIGLICGAPSGKLKQWIISRIVYYGNKMYRLRNRDYKRTFPYNVLKKITKIIPNSLYENVLFGIANKYPLEKCKYMVHLTAAFRNESKVLESKMYIPYSCAEFEERHVRVPAKYHEYLVQFYGSDYMTPVVWEKGVPQHGSKNNV